MGSDRKVRQRLTPAIAGTIQSYDSVIMESMPRDLNLVLPNGKSGLSSRGAKSIELLYQLLHHGKFAASSFTALRLLIYV
jgi:hypothetical protein